MSPLQSIQKELGERIRELRTSGGWSQEELASEAGMHRTYLSAIERGRSNPSLKLIAAVAKALGVTLSNLFKLKE